MSTLNTFILHKDTCNKAKQKKKSKWVGKENVKLYSQKSKSSKKNLRNLHKIYIKST